MSEKKSMSLSMRIKLSAMMFLQFLMMPVWFLAIGKFMGKYGASAEDWTSWIYTTMALGALTAPLIGMFADRFLNSEKVLAICNLVIASFLVAAWKVGGVDVGQGACSAPKTLFFLILGAMVFYMPTWSLTATIAMSNSTTEAFPRIRVFGSIGWAAAALFGIVAKCLGIENFEATSNIFLCGAVVAVLAFFLAFILPATRPEGRGKPMSIVDALGLRALSLFKRLDFLIYVVLIFLAMIPFQWYNNWTVPYLETKNFELGVAMMSWGQIAEMCFMVLLPIMLKKFGYKWAMVVGLLFLGIRYGAFYLGALDMGVMSQCGDIVGILVHGLIFGLLIVGSQMYVDAVVHREIRGQAQGLINLITFGVGTMASIKVFERIVPVQGATLGQYAHGYAIAAGSAAVLAVLMALLFRPRRAE